MKGYSISGGSKDARDRLLAGEIVKWITSPEGTYFEHVTLLRGKLPRPFSAHIKFSNYYRSEYGRKVSLRNSTYRKSSDGVDFFSNDPSIDWNAFDSIAAEFSKTGSFIFRLGSFTSLLGPDCHPKDRINSELRQLWELYLPGLPADVEIEAWIKLVSEAVSVLDNTILEQFDPSSPQQNFLIPWLCRECGYYDEKFVRFTKWLMYFFFIVLGLIFLGLIVSEFLP